MQCAVMSQHQVFPRSGSSISSDERLARILQADFDEESALIRYREAQANGAKLQYPQYGNDTSRKMGPVDDQTRRQGAPQARPSSARQRKPGGGQGDLGPVSPRQGLYPATRRYVASMAPSSASSAKQEPPLLVSPSSGRKARESWKGASWSDVVEAIGEPQVVVRDKNEDRSRDHSYQLPKEASRKEAPEEQEQVLRRNSSSTFLINDPSSSSSSDLSSGRYAWGDQEGPPGEELPRQRSMTRAAEPAATWGFSQSNGPGAEQERYTWQEQEGPRTGRARSAPERAEDGRSRVQQGQHAQGHSVQHQHAQGHSVQHQHAQGHSVQHQHVQVQRWYPAEGGAKGNALSQSGAYQGPSGSYQGPPGSYQVPPNQQRPIGASHSAGSLALCGQPAPLGQQHDSNQYQSGMGRAPDASGAAPRQEVSQAPYPSHSCMVPPPTAPVVLSQPGAPSHAFGPPYGTQWGYRAAQEQGDEAAALSLVMQELGGGAPHGAGSHDYIQPWSHVNPASVRPGPAATQATHAFEPVAVPAMAPPQPVPPASYAGLGWEAEEEAMRERQRVRQRELEWERAQAQAQAQERERQMQAQAQESERQVQAQAQERQRERVVQQPREREQEWERERERKQEREREWERAQARERERGQEREWEGEQKSGGGRNVEEANEAAALSVVMQELGLDSSPSFSRRAESMRHRLGRIESIPHVMRVNSIVRPTHEEELTEHQRLQRNLQQYALKELSMDGDGNCQFRALADQLYGNAKKHASVRKAVVAQLKQYGDRYAPYVPDSYSDYVKGMSKNGTWGDHVTLQAAADKYNAKITLITSFKEKFVVEIVPRASRPRLDLWLSYYAECHYNSVYAKEVPFGKAPSAGKKHWLGDFGLW